MADKTIGSLPLVSALTDDSSFVCEDSGEAKRVTGKQFKDFAKKGVSDEAAAQIQAIQSVGDAQTQRVIDEGTTQTANAKAQADAAAQSASGAAKSAQEAAESAAVYDNVVTDVNQLKQDLDDAKALSRFIFITDADDKEYAGQIKVVNGKPVLIYDELTT